MKNCYQWYMKRCSWEWTWPLASTSHSKSLLKCVPVAFQFLMDKIDKSPFLTNWIWLIVGNASHYRNTIGCKCYLDCNSATGSIYCCYFCTGDFMILYFASINYTSNVHSVALVQKSFLSRNWKREKWTSHSFYSDQTHLNAQHIITHK